ncbi:putative energy-sensing inhibitor of translation [Petrocella atlantisensis]|uniref:Putative energy-sensing inhibitor of translation n=1 Tax=Petrocella atlantisensis TaxID=2173034 RepID=A0A3P7S0D9_9FIRM|nr:ATP-binding cassette domain-containing protein [Petrocella atlantisensis]VDN46389.1 putative energy-sensing inhibitor of translation [Petrocella atlantisensis]
MITTDNVSLSFSDKQLFKNINLKFTHGNCYGVIGANGSGKSTFLKILSGDIEATTGDIAITKGERIAVLKQDHYAHDEDTVLDTVIMGHERLYSIIHEKDALYAKEDFTEEDGIKSAELEGEFAELGGWEAEYDAEKLLIGLDIPKDLHGKFMKDLTGAQKVKVLLAQALFGNPHILLLDEPTNHLDFKSIMWLEEFLINYDNTVIVVSHDRHFLNNVCTHIVDIDFGKAKMYVGNYDFWKESSELMLRLINDQNKKAEDKIAELKSFIARFSSNASKAKQATSRKKMLDKINIEDIQPSSRRYPFVGFIPDREVGKDILRVEGISKTVDGVKVLNNVTFIINKDDKIVFLSDNEIARTTLFQILMGEIEPDEGTFTWGVTTTTAYLPKDNGKFFNGVELNLVEWLRQYSKDDDESYIRGFLGKMLFSGEEALKKAHVLSGGEKVRCMLSRMMLSGANVIVLDEPTNHLDLESITAVNDGLIAYRGNVLFSSHDHKFIETVANRIIELTPNGIVDRMMEFDEWLANDELQETIKGMYE